MHYFFMMAYINKNDSSKHTSLMMATRRKYTIKLCFLIKKTCMIIIKAEHILLYIDHINYFLL